MKTELELRIALAEVQGLKGPWQERGTWISMRGEDHFKDSNPGDVWTIILSNPQGHRLPELTLDWVHEIEKNLKPEQWRYYSDKLMVAVRDSDLTLNGSNIEARYKCAHATKEQRAEAILKTQGLWREG